MCTNCARMKAAPHQIVESMHPYQPAKLPVLQDRIKELEDATFVKMRKDLRKNKHVHRDHEELERERKQRRECETQLDGTRRELQVEREHQAKINAHHRKTEVRALILAHILPVLIGALIVCAQLLTSAT